MAKDWKKILNETREIAKRFSVKLKKVGEVVKVDARIGTKMGGLKVKELNLERERLAKIFSLGKRTYALYGKSKIGDKQSDQLCTRIKELERLMGNYKKQFQSLKKNLKRL